MLPVAIVTSVLALLWGPFRFGRSDWLQAYTGLRLTSCSCEANRRLNIADSSPRNNADFHFHSLLVSSWLRFILDTSLQQMLSCNNSTILEQNATAMQPVYSLLPLQTWQKVDVKVGYYLPITDSICYKFKNSLQRASLSIYSFEVLASGAEDVNGSMIRSGKQSLGLEFASSKKNQKKKV
jgi:hypothetical protein